MLDEKNEVDHVEKAYASTTVQGPDTHPEQDWTQEEERVIVKKADWRVFPMLCVVFGLSLLDRSNISAAYIAGLAKDLSLTGQRYNIALLVFFIGMYLKVLVQSQTKSSSKDTAFSNCLPITSSVGLVLASGYHFSSLRGAAASWAWGLSILGRRSLCCVLF